MQADSPDEQLVRETMASLGPGAKDASLDDVAAWIRQLEELSDSKDATLASDSFRTDISGSCLSKMPTEAQTTKLQSKAIKGYPPLPELHMEKVSSRKKNARGEAKLRLIVDRGPMLVLLTITDLHGITRTLRVVTEDDKASGLIPIKHPATTIEATAIPFTPDQLLDQLRIVEANMKPQREEPVQPNASPQPSVVETSAQRQADGVRYVTKRVGGQVVECTFDSETGTMTMKSSGCGDPNCDLAKCTAPPFALTRNLVSGETGYTIDGPQTNDDVPPVLKSFLENPRRHVELSKRAAALLEEEKAIQEKLPTAKPAEKKRLLKDLEKKSAEYAKLTDLVFRTAETGGWMGVPKEELNALLENAMQKEPVSVDALDCRARAALAEYNKLKEKHESTSNESKKKRLSVQLVRKEIEFDEAMNEIAVIADSIVQEDSKELNDVSVRMNEALTLADDSEPEDRAELNDVSEQEHSKDPNDASVKENCKELPDASEEQDRKELPDASAKENFRDLDDASDQEDRKELNDASEQEDVKELYDPSEQEDFKELPDASEQEDRKELNDASEEDSKELLDASEEDSKELLDASKKEDFKELNDASVEQDRKELNDASEEQDRKELHDPSEQEDFKELLDVPSRMNDVLALVFGFVRVFVFASTSHDSVAYL